MQPVLVWNPDRRIGGAQTGATTQGQQQQAAAGGSSCRQLTADDLDVDEAAAVALIGGERAVAPAGDGAAQADEHCVGARREGGHELWEVRVVPRGLSCQPRVVDQAGAAREALARAIQAGGVREHLRRAGRLASRTAPLRAADGRDPRRPQAANLAGGGGRTLLPRRCDPGTTWQ